jgi:peroxiredoxin Q/BCP
MHRLLALAALAAVAWPVTALALDKPPAVGDTAPDFALKDIEGREVRLSELQMRGPVVLVVLRGYPGYQCPICNAQAGEFLAQAHRFAAAKARVVFVYPGSADSLTGHAREFLKERSLPEGFHFLVDPDYGFTNAYALRWNKPRETAYPSTFVIDPRGAVRFAMVSSSHGGRAKAADVLQALNK